MTRSGDASRGLASAVRIGDAGTALTSAGEPLPLEIGVVDVQGLGPLVARADGAPEAYVILEADPGATMQLGFARDVDRGELSSWLVAGRDAQDRLIEILRPDVSPATIERAIRPRLSERPVPLGELSDALLPLRRPDASLGELRLVLMRLTSLYWEVLDLLNTVPAAPGQVILNAEGAVRALGNPAGNRFVALSIAPQAESYRAWDHLRFPPRDLLVDQALSAARLTHSDPASFVVEPEPIEGRPDLLRSATSPTLHVLHVRPDRGRTSQLPRQLQDSVLCCARGAAELRGPDGAQLGELRPGQHAVVPAGAVGLSIVAMDDDVEVIQAVVPVGAHEAA